MLSCPSCGRQLAAGSSCASCADPEATRTAGDRRAARLPPPVSPPAVPPSQYAPYQQPPPPLWLQSPQDPASYAPQQPFPQPSQQPFQQPLQPPRRPSGRGRVVAMVGGGAAMLLVIGLCAWAVTGLGSDEDGPGAQSPSPSASTEVATEPESSPSPEAATEPSLSTTPGAGPSDDATSTTYDLASGSESVELTIVVDGPTTVTATPDEPEDVVLTVLGPGGEEVCRSDASFVEPESCTLQSPQVGEVYEVVVSTYGDVPGGTGTVGVG